LDQLTLTTVKSKKYATNTVLCTPFICSSFLIRKKRTSWAPFNLRRHKNDLRDRERYMRLSAIFSSIGEKRRNQSVSL